MDTSEIRAFGAKLRAMSDELETLQAQADEHATELQEKHDSRSDAWQDGEKGQESADRINNWEAARDALDAAMQSVEECITALQDAGESV